MNTTDVFHSLEEMQRVHRDLLAKHRETQGDSAFSDRVVAFMEKGSATGVMLGEERERDAAQALLDYWYSVMFREDRERVESHDEVLLRDFDLSTQPQLNDDDCPYRGLDSFCESESDYFFGREDDVQTLIARLAQDQVLVLVGRGGSGNSSVVAAGLLPALRRGGLPGSENWTCLPIVTPGTCPFKQLMRAALQDPTASLVQNSVQGAPLRSHALAQVLEERGIGDAVLVVDALEELLVLCSDRAEQDAFVQNLAGFLEGYAGQRRIVLVLNSDFEEYLARFPKLERWYAGGHIRLPPLDARRIRDVILKPARHVGLHFEERVVDAIVNDTLGEPSALLLLQFTLIKLWKHRQRNLITWAVYEEIRGGRRALMRAAKTFYESLDKEEQEICRSIFLQLVVLARSDTGIEREPVFCRVTAKRVGLPSLLPKGGQGETAKRVIEGLERENLIRVTRKVAPDQPEVQIAHEALFQSWDQLGRWFDEERDLLRLRYRLDEYAAEWVRRGRGDFGLLDGVQILEAEKWLNSPHARRIGIHEALPELVRRSQWAQKMGQRRIKIWAITATVVAFSVILLTGTVYMQRLEIASNLDKLMNISWRARSNLDFVAGLVDSAEALNHELSSDQILEPAVRANKERRLESLRSEANSKIHWIRERADYVMVRANNGEFVSVEELNRKIPEESQDLTKEPDLPGRPPAARVQTVADGPLVADGSIDTLPRQPAIVAGLVEKLVFEESFIERQLWGLALTTDGNRVAVGADDGQIHLWDFQTSPTPTSWPSGQKLVNALAFYAEDGDGESLLASGGMEGTLRIWDLNSTSSTGKPKLKFEKVLGGRLYDIAFAPPTTSSIPLVAVATSENRLVLLQLTETMEKAQSLLHPDDVFGVAFSPDGRRLATASGDRNVRLWNLKDGFPESKEPSRLFEKHTDAVIGLAFHPDKPRLASSSMDSTAVVWDLEGSGDPVLLTGHARGLGSIRYSPDGRFIATAGADLQVRIWDPESPATVLILRNFNGPVFGLRFASSIQRDRYRLATTSLDGSLRVWEVRRP